MTPLSAASAASPSGPGDGRRRMDVDEGEPMPQNPELSACASWAEGTPRRPPCAQEEATKR